MLTFYGDGDAAHPRAESVAVTAKTIVAVGSDAEVARLAGPRTKMIELHGHAVVPALTDGHAHLAGLGLAMAQADLRGCASPDACALSAKAVAGEWALGRGWDQNRWAGQAVPDSHEPRRG